MKKRYILIIFISILLVGLSIIGIRKNKIYFLAYNVNKKEFMIYIKEYDNYIPYLVLHNNYNKSGNALLLRLNTIGNDISYVYDYNGIASKENIYNDQIEMQTNSDYYETDLDKFLIEEFYKRFDKSFVNLVKDTELLFSFGVNNKTYTLKRKFFILSESELGFDSTMDAVRSNITYFDNNEKRIAVNDAGRITPYWTRTINGASAHSFNIIGYTGLPFVSGTGAKYSIRPAMTISNKTKIKEIYDDSLQKNIYVLDLKN